MSRHQYLAPRGPPPPVSIPSKGISRITKSTQACDKCRLSRRRCNGATPCASCYASQIPCEYSHTDGRKKERFKAQIKALEERNAYLEQVVQQLSVNRADGAVQQPNAFIDQSLDAVQRQEPQAAAQQALPERPRLETSASIAPSGEAACGNHATHQSTSEADLQHMFYVATATRPVCGSLRLPYRRVQTDQRHKLPEKHVTRQALGAFFQCAATLFYVTTEEKSTQLLNKVYDSNIASLQDICELCALAAIGSHYKVDDIPDEARATYFFMASTSLHEAIEADGIQGMRIFICLCMSMVMEKCSIARLLIISALNLARGKMVANLQRQRTASTGSEEDEHRRTLQTLLFLEGWLSFSLGYRNCLNKSEIDLVHYTIPINQTENASALTTRLIQSHMTKLTLLASGIQDQISTYGTTNYWRHADMLSMRLDTWHQSLPPDLQLAALSISGSGPSPAQRLSVLQERALYLMHMLYMDMRLQLYCQLLKASYESGAEGDEGFLAGLFGQVPRLVSEMHSDYAVQLARIVALLYNENAIMTRCWLAIRSVFDACVVLLLTHCERFAVESPATFVRTDISLHVETCLAVLAFCSRRDVAADRLRDMLNSVFRELISLNMPTSSNSNSGSGSSFDPVSGSRLSPPGLHMGQDAIHIDSEDDQGEMRIENVLNRSPPTGTALVRITRRLLDMMSPGGNVWVESTL